MQTPYNELESTMVHKTEAPVRWQHQRGLPSVILSGNRKKQTHWTISFHYFVTACKHNLLRGISNRLGPTPFFHRCPFTVCTHDVLLCVFPTHTSLAHLCSTIWLSHSLSLSLSLLPKTCPHAPVSLLLQSLSLSPSAEVEHDVSG